jgi:hypothetical protein
MFDFKLVKNFSHVEIFRGEERACPHLLACMRAHLGCDLRNCPERFNIQNF